MESSGMERVYQLADWIMKIAYINLLAIFFSMVGLFVFGFFPAIAATFAVLRKWLIGYSDIPITKTFWCCYKKEFFKSNLIGFILVTVGSLLFINLSIAEIMGHKIIQYSYYPILAVWIIFLSACLYVFPVSLHYHVSIKQIFKNAFLLLFVQPKNTIIMIASIIILYFLLISIPGLIPLFGVSLFAWIVMYFSLHTFNKLEENMDLAG
ncbi:YesL family protein [Gracilibacillus sp. YIM 98692]|uniref:YesL family protein n=1 Tax=Gracilibacillus sp. YIM 98692 TaxID=2663532 RepID=UPI0013D67CD5|nr:YesL family protein [Gracilibacillus sp. YIM 98692]